MQNAEKKRLVFFLAKDYDKKRQQHIARLQGRVRFPIGGIVRERSSAQDLAQVQVRIW